MPDRGLSDGRLHVNALEGGGNLAAAFLKNRCTQDHEEPQGGEKGQGTDY
jgi:hypothetical protein